MRLKAIASAVPDEKWSAHRIAKLVGADVDFIENKVGIREKYILRANERGIELAQRSVINLFGKCGIEAEAIDFLIYVTQTPEYRIPQNSALLHDALNLRSDCGAYDISLGCSGWVYALMTAKGLIATGEFDNVMIVTCDPYSKIMDPRDKGTAAVFGDGAAASLVTRDEGLKIGFGDYGTAGHKHRSLIVEAGGSSDPVQHWHGASLDIEGRDFTIKMQGREVFNFVLSSVPASIEKCLAKNKLSKDDIAVFALHQGCLLYTSPSPRD